MKQLFFSMDMKLLRLILFFAGMGLLNGLSANPGKIPVVVITDLYHPYQDPGDNLDLLNGFSLPDVDLKAVILDITDSFRKDTADHPTLWKDPRGPREAGIIPVLQLNYIFNRQVRFAVGPIKLMRSENDKMFDTPRFFQGVELFLDVLKHAEEPVDVLSFGSARVLAVAYNREPGLLKRKVRMIHLSAGTAAPNYEKGSDAGANMIPGGEWNVALDVFAFTRVLRSSLPVALYPCAGKDGGFVKTENNTYWTLKDMSFVKEMDPHLQCYLDFAFGKKTRYDFLRAMDMGSPYVGNAKIQFDEFHVWESAIWIEATNRVLAKDIAGKYKLVKKSGLKQSDVILESGLRPCIFSEIHDDGRFIFEYVDKPTNKSIYYRSNPEENEAALNAVIPELFKSYKPIN
jgi:pyrimidine-specific ribonucleoside hydrolase